MQNNKPISYTQQGEIHLRELLNLLINSKKIIIVVTLFFSLIATIYTYSLKPQYEANSVIEVGSYFDHGQNLKYIDYPKEVAEDLKIKFVKIPNQTTGNNILHSVSFLGNQYILMKSISTSSDTAIKNLENVQHYLTNYPKEKFAIEQKKLELLINTRHQPKIDSAEKEIQVRYQKIEQLKLLIEQLKLQNDSDKNKLDDIDKNELEQRIIHRKKEMQIVAFYLDEYKTLLKEVDEKIKILKSSDSDLSSSILLISEKRKLSELIGSHQNQLEDIEYFFKFNVPNQKENLEKEIQSFSNQKEYVLDEITQIKSIIQKNDYSVISTYSEITTKQVPVRKLFIIIAGFVVGFFLSIFVVFIRQAFLQEQK